MNLSGEAEILQFKGFNEIKIVTPDYNIRIRRSSTGYQRKLYWKSLSKRRDWENCTREFVMHLIGKYIDVLHFSRK
jgi:hypothetical protein